MIPTTQFQVQSRPSSSTIKRQWRTIVPLFPENIFSLSQSCMYACTWNVSHCPPRWILWSNRTTTFDAFFVLTTDRQTTNVCVMMMLQLCVRVPLFFNEDGMMRRLSWCVFELVVGFGVWFDMKSRQSRVQTRDCWLRRRRAQSSSWVGWTDSSAERGMNLGCVSAFLSSPPSLSYLSSSYLLIHHHHRYHIITTLTSLPRPSNRYQNSERVRARRREQRKVS